MNKCWRCDAECEETTCDNCIDEGFNWSDAEIERLKEMKDD